MAVAAMGAMAPALASAGVSLVGGLAGQAAQAKQAKRQRILDALGKEMQAKQQAGQMLASGTANATQTMLSGLGQALR